MRKQIELVEKAIQDLKHGKMVILIDDPERENEGDLIIPAETITPDVMNFMIRNGSGIVCLSMTAERLEKLNLPLMVSADQNSSCRGTPFTISIDARDDITTGVSAADRTKTVQVAIDDHATPETLVRPGHIFPLQAKMGGVFQRQGHTEGSVDLARLAGFKPAAVICEIMNPDGTMTRGTQLTAFAAKHQITMLSIEDILTYRLQQENLIEEQTSTVLPLENYGTFKMTVIKEKYTGIEHIILANEKIKSYKSELVRIHSACTTGDLFSSLRCDCHKQLHYSLQKISEEGGMLIYLNQEGRGIGLFNKIKAYALQEQGLDTIDANLKLGLPVDARKYYIAAIILRHYGITQVRLLSNNPDKLNDLRKYGIQHVEKEFMPVFENSHNHAYLQAKKDKLHHVINFD